MLMLAALLMVTTSAAQSAAGELKPDWNLTLQRGIEWCVPVDGKPATALLICTKDAKLNVIDLHTGRSRLIVPITVQPGTVFAGQRGNLAFCHGPTAVYAVRTGSGSRAGKALAGLIWRIAAAPAPSGDDPESFTRIVAGQATQAGVLIVRSDGRIAELSKGSGEVLWRNKLPRISNCTLRVSGEVAVMMWTSGESLRIVHLDLSRGKPTLSAHTLDAALPIWSTLLGDRLIAVWPRRFVVVPAGGAAAWFEMPAGGRPASAAGIGVYVPAKPAGLGRPGTNTPIREYLLIPNASDVLLAYDLRTGEARPRAAPVAGATDAPRVGSPARMRIAGNIAIVVGSEAVAFLNAASGQTLAFMANRGTPVSADIRGQLARAVFSDGSGILRMVCETVTDSSSPLLGGPVEAGRREQLLGNAGRVRETFWLGGMLIVVEEDRVRAYSLR